MTHSGLFVAMGREANASRIMHLPPLAPGADRWRIYAGQNPDPNVFMDVVPGPEPVRCEKCGAIIPIGGWPWCRGAEHPEDHQRG